MDIVNQAFADFLANIPSRPIVNPYWVYNRDDNQIKYAQVDMVFDPSHEWLPLLRDVRDYFRLVFDAFHTEAQVLCVDAKDAEKLSHMHIPKLDTTYHMQAFDVVVFVLPQYNTGANSIIHEKFWQTAIIGQGITPIARIHSHHILDAYQSSTDYATLNSNTLELVIGHINIDPLHVGFWLDVRGTETKSHVWLFNEAIEQGSTIHKIPCGCLKHTITQTREGQKEEVQL